MVRNAHLLGFFRFICKLMFLRTKPVFVFDGGTPALKRRTVIHALGTRNMNGCNSDFDGNGLSMEVSAIYLAMKKSKLECVDEHGQDPMSFDIYTEEDEFEDFDDFDPYLFIKTLLDLSTVLAMHGEVDPAVLASLPPSMQLDLLVQVV
ncbi:unnamed protein product [Sphenostylis stenocarpa]|uniref:XPG N-terminal domain-containing protein n=1 Tax=Sphenostylis stenocarpa TaxID=92480 RepID=A0AA87B8C2_9FABA|nr:unnamed protein product [Sphenostylis stenocarpa]